MTGVAAGPAGAGPAAGRRRTRRIGAGLAAAGLVAAAAFGAAAGPAAARFTFGEGAGGAGITLPGRAGAVGFGLLAVAAGALLCGPRPPRRAAALGVGVVAVLLSFLCWQVAQAPPGQNFLPLGSTLRGTFLLALPLVYGALAGVLCERSGIVNVAIEGQLLAGAFAGALVGTVTGSPWAGLVAAALGGVLLSALLAVFAIRYLVDQVVLGIVVNLLAIGLTGFLYEALMQPDQARYNEPPKFAEWSLGPLADLPVLGPALGRGTLFLYLAAIAVPATAYALGRTRWGLRTRAVGEHPGAADTLGVRVRRLRYLNVLLAGAVAGVGGASYTLVSFSFSKDMIGGKGFIALAALIFGRWTPTGALLAALFFGFADQVQTYLGTVESAIPTEFLQMLPYLATILAVAGLVGRVRAPAADGKPYLGR
ncbi:ABC transporter permease [Pilimelia terevasa]|uniref:ABC transporter permease n=1 Tax=Pilimelia terevasa TaxID=53372 RepID=A0A8J3FHV4_9ACTN|nr:ABC transporter permease [Pilimelia terevasa]GGK30795.1 ABC transporter permease [Pilimelia terevasa]